MHVKLKVLRGSSAGKEVAIRGPKFYIGRADECNLRVNSDAISRRHCVITIDDSTVLIRDLGSRNGTYVNGNRIEGENRLQTGDQLRVGPLEFLVTYAQVANEAKAVKASDSAISTDDDMAGMVSDWLEEADEAERGNRVSDSKTREYKAVKPQAATPANASAKASPEDTQETPKPATSETQKMRRSNNKNAPKDTQEAAAQMLRKFFNRG